MVTLNHLVHIPFMKLTFSHQRMDGWKVIFLGSRSIFKLLLLLVSRKSSLVPHITLPVNEHSNGKWTMNEDVFPTENCDFPASHASFFPEGTKMGGFTRIFPAR